LVKAVIGIFDSIVQQRSSKGYWSDAELGKNAGYLERVSDVRLARLANLRSVSQLGDGKRSFDNRKIGLRMIQLRQAKNFVEL
jgi:hypothetical protein